MRSAPESEIAKAVYRLRIMTRGREQRADGDREAEAVIWIEELRFWPGDIVIDVLKTWPNRKDGAWWPTWHDVEAELRHRASTRQSIANHVERQAKALAPHAERPISSDERAKVGELMLDLAKKYAPPEKPGRHVLQSKEFYEAELAAMAAQVGIGEPIRVSASLIEKLEQQEER